MQAKRFSRVDEVAGLQAVGGESGGNQMLADAPAAECRAGALPVDAATCPFQLCSIDLRPENTGNNALRLHSDNLNLAFGVIGRAAREDRLSRRRSERVEVKTRLCGGHSRRSHTPPYPSK